MYARARRRRSREDDAVWRALASPLRRGILDALRRGPRTTGEIAGGLPHSRFAAMKHLAVLAAAGLVVVERVGRERWNHLNPAPLRRAVRRWVGPYEQAWADAVLGLRAASERRPRRRRRRWAERASR
jgi:DNA-binding transcriptional ArsR family regulator